MSRIGNKLRAGFFATPPRQGEYLIKLLHVEGSGVWLDPTCGEGEILHQISAPFQAEDCSISTYGVELDKGRAEKARKLLDHCINAPIESMVIQNNAVSLLFLNPPYDHTMKGIGDDYTERKEWTELYRSMRFLKERGLMIYIIPSYRFADKKIARFLATQFNNVGIMRFSDEDYEDFRQCIFIGNKKTGKHKDFNQKLYDFLLQMESEDFVMRYVTPINRFVLAEKKWRVPAGVKELQPFYTKLANKADFVEGIRSSNGFQAFLNRTRVRQLELGGNPILPLNAGQMALLLAAGAINGEIGEGDSYHLVQGLEIVKTISSEEKKTNNDGSVTQITRLRTKREVSVKIITPTGLIRKLV
ncbi:DUF6094 domain-containing protein [Caldibacillus debilis]|uniref:DUF6094 domain-containing protein n=1 Tax=Caldibacillus debilis TaxID=301148 RepID=A0A150MF45_9BACI|nr:DUF6094 domain-containing protein [Caldibacillus debilis]KYD23150.1 hypothetical protein B4135_0973 [Caldibacillus debilis]